LLVGSELRINSARSLWHIAIIPLRYAVVGSVAPEVLCHYGKSPALSARQVPLIGRPGGPGGGLFHNEFPADNVTDSAPLVSADWADQLCLRGQCAGADSGSLGSDHARVGSSDVLGFHGSGNERIGMTGAWSSYG
jgi:hypothetical protein